MLLIKSDLTNYLSTKQCTVETKNHLNYNFLKFAVSEVEKIKTVEYYELKIFKLLFSSFKKDFKSFLKEEEHEYRVRILFSSAEIVDGNYVISDEAYNSYTAYVNSNFISDFLLGLKLAGKIDLAIRQNYSDSIKSSEDDLKRRLKKSLKKEYDFDFDANDERTLEAISQDFYYWIGQTYDTAMADKINKIAYDVINRGLGEEAVVDAFMKELGKEYAKLGRIYFTILASTVVNNSRSFGAIKTYYEYEVTDYEYVAVLDRRTTEICRSLDGKYFSVEKAIGVIRELITAMSPEDVRYINPFLRWDSDRGEPFYVRDGEEIYIPINGDEKEIGKIGFLFPPNHYLCRSTVVPNIRTETR